ncbi:MAG: hypothetical protein ACHP9Z_20860, partial [Streptosporangiales bacterium]
MLRTGEQAADGGAGGDQPSRRVLLRAGALSGGAAVALAAGGAAGRADAAVSHPAGKYPPFALFRQEDLNFETLFALGSAGYGTSEVGEIVTAVNQVNARGASYQAYFDCFGALAMRVSGLADAELKAGHTVSARSAYLHAATYWDLCLYFVLGTRARVQEADVYARMQYNWDRATQLFDPPFERVRIPYRGGWLPGYFLRPAG